MTSIRGNKFLAAGTGLWLTSMALVFGGIVSEKRTKIRLYEAKYKKAVTALEVNNKEIMAEEKEFLKK